VTEVTHKGDPTTNDTDADPPELVNTLNALFEKPPGRRAQR
jgi:hypothetical protein